MTDWVLTLLWWSRQMYTLTPLWKTAGSPWRLGESEREMRKNIKRTKGGYRQANSKHYTFTGLINHSCYESSPWNMWQLLTWHTDESYRPWVDVFLLFAFLFRIQHLDHKRGNMKQAFQQTSQNTLYSLSSYF